MSTLLLKDIERRPDLFHFLGPISSEKLETWLTVSHLVVPNDLKQIWCQTGGGDMFESETILSPFGRIDLADDVETVNQFHRRNGMAADWVIFHVGIGGFSVVQMASGKYASVREHSYEVQQTYTSLAEWYAKLVRKEYAPRYGLAD